MTTTTKEEQAAIGEIKIARVVEMEGPMMRPTDLLPAVTSETLDAHRSWLEPHYLSSDGIFIMSIQSFVIRTNQHTILVDTCVGNDKRRNVPAWNNLNLPYLRDLSVIGYAAEDIDVVLCTHLHVDHVGWNTRLENGRWMPTFPNARYLFTEQEWEFWNAKPDIQSYNQASIEDSVLPVIKSGQADLVSTGESIDRSAWLEFTPGHTPGHVTLHLESKGSEAVLAGDVFHHPLQVAEPQLRAEYLDIDPEAAEATRIAFLDRYTDEEVLILGSHFANPPGGWIRMEGQTRRFIPV